MGRYDTDLWYDVLADNSLRIESTFKRFLNKNYFLKIRIKKATRGLGEEAVVQQLFEIYLQEAKFQYWMVAIEITPHLQQNKGVITFSVVQYYTF